MSRQLLPGTLAPAAAVSATAAVLVASETSIKSSETGSLSLLLSPSSRLSPSRRVGTPTRASSSSSSSQLLFSITALTLHHQLPPSPSPCCCCRCRRRRCYASTSKSRSVSRHGRRSRSHGRATAKIGANNSDDDSVGKDEDSVITPATATRASIRNRIQHEYRVDPLPAPLLLLGRCSAAAANGWFRNPPSCSCSQSPLLPNNTKKMETAIKRRYGVGRGRGHAISVSSFVQLITVLSKLLLLHSVGSLARFAVAAAAFAANFSSAKPKTQTRSLLLSHTYRLSWTLPILIFCCFMIVSPANSQTTTANASATSVRSSSAVSENSTIIQTEQTSISKTSASIQDKPNLPSTNPDEISGSLSRINQLKDSGFSISFGHDGYKVFLDNKHQTQTTAQPLRNVVVEELKLLTAGNSSAQNVTTQRRPNSAYLSTPDSNPNSSLSVSTANNTNKNNHNNKSSVNDSSRPPNLGQSLANSPSVASNPDQPVNAAVNDFMTSESKVDGAYYQVQGETLRVHFDSNDVETTNGEDLLSSENIANYYAVTNSSKAFPSLADAAVQPHGANNYYINNTQSLRILSQIRRDLSQRIGRGSSASYSASGKVARVVTHDDFEQDDLDVQECDRVFVSTPTSKNGTFESPKLIAEDDHSIQCIFTFVPRPGERVQIAFKSFNIRGIPPECVHEWIDLYTEVDGTDVTDLISTPFAGRYCGLIPPRPRISLFGGIAIGFYSDRNITDDDEIRFSGQFSFISDDRYMVGTPVPRTICSFTIYGSSKRQGELRSPTYPGTYPKDLACTYKFIGTVGQRIRIEFRDFDVFSGGPSCPFDDVKVFDGMDPTAPLIGTYCGPQRYLVIFSSEHLMFVTFTTRERTFESQNRGFTALWEFSESFVKLDFIGKNAGEHIRGTECDQLILSKGQSQGAVYSPNYPFPYLPKIYCKYFIYGLQDAQHLERVKLSFEKFDVPSSTHSEEDLSSTHKDKESKCGDGHVKIYVKAQEVIGGFDKPDYEFCGKDIPEEISSDQPRLVLAFSSGEIQGSGFKAKYAFEIEYKIPGTPAPDHSCQFTYLSTSAKFGEFNSPRYPSNYPSNMNCTYTFTALPSEQIRIVFDHFKLRNDKVNHTAGGAYGNEICIQDFVEIYNVFKEGRTRLIGRYCSKSAPGPVESHEEAEAVKVVLHLDEEGVYSGFKARYFFFTTKSLFGECGMNYSATASGTLTSPGWPGTYEGPKTKEGSFRCNWFLAAKPGNRILLHFQIFIIEGHPFDRGCPAAAVRVWEDPQEGLPVELCGEDLTPEQTQYISVKNTMRVTFITGDKAVGARGFAAIWSEVHDRIGSSSCQANFIPCAKAPYCIPEELMCDGAKNCGMVDGEADDSDESICGLDNEFNVIIIMVLSIASGSCCVLILCFWGQRKRRKRRRRMQLRRPPIHVCDNAGARFAAMDSV